MTTALARQRTRAVVLVNLGTPDAPTVPAVRRYLAEFLSDPLVIDLPAPFRWLLLNAIILPFRPKRSAHAYQAIWTEQGSPLMVNSVKQRDALARRLPDMKVVLAMRYGAPSLAAALAELKAEGVREVMLVPLYPQAASATTGSTIGAWEKLLAREGDGLSSVAAPAFFSESGFVESCAANVKQVVAAHRIEHVLFSYHGLPVRQIARVCGATCVTSEAVAPCTEGPSSAGCYRSQCFATTRLVAAASGVAQHSTAFQSRLKGAAWIAPFTEDSLVALAKQGVRRIAVACPSFVADCLETLEEIGLRAKATFIAAGGEELVLVPAVNDAPRFVELLATLVEHAWAEPRNTGAAA